MKAWQLAQNLSKGLRTYLGGSPRSFRHLSQFYIMNHLLFSTPSKIDYL